MALSATVLGDKQVKDHQLVALAGVLNIDYAHSHSGEAHASTKGATFTYTLSYDDVGQWPFVCLQQDQDNLLIDTLAFLHSPIPNGGHLSTFQLERKSYGKLEWF